MESLHNIFKSVRDAFYQLNDNIIEDNKMPELEAVVVTGPARRTRSTSIMAPDFFQSAPGYDLTAFKSESKNFALKHFGLYPENNSNSEENEPSEDPKKKK